MAELTLGLDIVAPGALTEVRHKLDKIHVASKKARKTGPFFIFFYSPSVHACMTTDERIPSVRRHNKTCLSFIQLTSTEKRGGYMVKLSILNHLTNCEPKGISLTEG